MLLKHIKARNFKTYLNLDLDLTVQPDRPIVLIGGANGGGKTTFFEAVSGALYGLNFTSASQFRQYLNAGALGREEERIVLELYFSGRVLNQEYDYVLRRTYILNPEGRPVESVRLNMGGSVFEYGSATPAAQRLQQEAQVSKIIKANLPRELSRYFLFDAMEAGNLLKEDQLNRVIRENIENVMGFNKYLLLAKAAQRVTEAYTAQRLQVEKEKQEYLGLVEQRKKLEADSLTLKARRTERSDFQVANVELYQNLKAGLNQETQLKAKIGQLEQQIEATRKRETQYRADVESFAKNLEAHVFLPKLAEALRAEVSLIQQTRQADEERRQEQLSPTQVQDVARRVMAFLQSQQIEVSETALIDYLQHGLNGGAESGPYDFLEVQELKALDGLVGSAFQNPFPLLHQQRAELDLALGQVPALVQQINALRAQVSGSDYNLLRQYEEAGKEIEDLTRQIAELDRERTKLDRRLSQFDIQASEEPDPRYEALKKLRPFFEAVANHLLRVKKQQLQLKMKQDLNLNLAAYRDVIDRVELSEDLRDLSFRIYHRAGNEIYLNQLNTASKQIVVQVLLKALHEFGDYDPPVMIDTVMGVLDETSRATVLENYFPALSHQTILLSSDSEIRPTTDWPRLEAYVSKAFTAVRDRENQCTNLVPGYFGEALN